MSAGRRRRSVLFAPGHRADLLRKMTRSGPDCVVLDLEDGTPEDAKDTAREVVARALREVSFGGAERIVRLNAARTPYIDDDIRWLRDLDAEVDAVLLPKVEGAADLEGFERAAGGGRWPLWILPTETAAGYERLPESVAHPAVTAVIWAAEDFAADIGAAGSRQPDGVFWEVFRVARARTLLAAKAAGVDAIDTTYVDLGDLDGLRAEAEYCHHMGFDGKAAIHPSHIPVINAVFTPSDGEVERATRLVEAFRAAGGGAIRFEGRMVDAPHYHQAIRVLTRAGRGRVRWLSRYRRRPTRTRVPHGCSRPARPHCSAAPKNAARPTYGPGSCSYATGCGCCSTRRASRTACSRGRGTGSPPTPSSPSSARSTAVRSASSPTTSR